MSNFRAHDSSRPSSSRLPHPLCCFPTGLSPLALLASDQGWSVSGSDQAFASPQLDLLREKGVTVVAGGQRAETIERLLSTSPPNPIYVVASSAVKSDNPELQAAVKHGLSVLKRDQWLPVFTAGKRVLAVSGTHGKTTTTALLSYLLWKVNQELGGVQDPCCTRSLMAVVGGNVSQFPTGSGALSWRGASDGTAHDGAARDDFVIEADEYDRAFLGLSPYISIVSLTRDEEAWWFARASIDRTSLFLELLKHAHTGPECRP